MDLPDLIREEHSSNRTTEDILVVQAKWPLLRIVQLTIDLTVLSALNVLSALIVNVPIANP